MTSDMWVITMPDGSLRTIERKEIADPVPIGAVPEIPGILITNHEYQDKVMRGEIKCSALEQYFVETLYFLRTAQDAKIHVDGSLSGKFEVDPSSWGHLYGSKG